MSRPLVTIVTPSFNQGHFIRATIESVLSQDYPNIEYIIMDGGSTDSTAAVASAYADRLTFISEPDRGQTHAINKGFQRARGEIFAWINSDDTLLPGAVTAAVNALESNPQVGAVYGDGHWIDAEGRITGRFPFTEPFNLWRLMYVCDYILQQSCYFRRSALEALGWLDESLHWTMDWDILIRLGLRYGLHYVPAEMGALREYAETKTASGGPRRFREIRSMLSRHTHSFWSPACTCYGLDTYDRRWRDALQSLGLKRLGQMVYQCCRLVIDYFFLNAQGFYGAAWAGPRFHWILPVGARQIIVRGEIPAWPGTRPRQKIRVFARGRLLSAVELPPGPFEWTFDAGALGESQALHLVFQSEWRTKATPDSGAPLNVPLSWRVTSISAAP